jgi:hypothetical protein
VTETSVHFFFFWVDKTVGTVVGDVVELTVEVIVASLFSHIPLVLGLT